MAQLTIYLDDGSLREIEKAAKSENSSVSKWVKTRLTQSLENQWPANYFELFGSLRDVELSRPAQLDFANDSPREQL